MGGEKKKINVIRYYKYYFLHTKFCIIYTCSVKLAVKWNSSKFNIWLMYSHDGVSAFRILLDVSAVELSSISNSRSIFSCSSINTFSVWETIDFIALEVSSSITIFFRFSFTWASETYPLSHSVVFLALSSHLLCTTSYLVSFSHSLNCSLLHLCTFFKCCRM